MSVFFILYGVVMCLLGFALTYTSLSGFCYIVGVIDRAGSAAALGTFVVNVVMAIGAWYSFKGALNLFSASRIR